MGPLDGLLVLDFSTLLPGPLASLVLADVGARVVKIEPVGRGEGLRDFTPKLGEDSVPFALLNRGKQSIAIDLKAADAVERLKPLIQRADIVIEQFRPGVMDRLGLGYEAMHRLNRKLIYCAITGWGQSGPQAGVAAHDLNYMAETGSLSLTAGADGAPVLPPILAADIAGGSFPALVNILLALRRRDMTGLGCHLDIAMAENLFVFNYWGLGSGHSGTGWPTAGNSLVTGASPRYQIYRTADGRYLAAAPLEDRFWKNFTRIIGLPAQLAAPEADPAKVIGAVSRIIAERSAADWQAAFEGADVCCAIVATLEEAARNPHFTARNVFSRPLKIGAKDIPALPLPIAPLFRSDTTRPRAPALGETTDPLLSI